eukprot:2540590-Prymnesium_polylepis.1
MIEWFQALAGATYHLRALHASHISAARIMRWRSSLGIDRLWSALARRGLAAAAFQTAKISYCTDSDSDDSACGRAGTVHVANTSKVPNIENWEHFGCLSKCLGR